jgi:hypothetical protein
LENYHLPLTEFEFRIVLSVALPVMDDPMGWSGVGRNRICTHAFSREKEKKNVLSKGHALTLVSRFVPRLSIFPNYLHSSALNTAAKCSPETSVPISKYPEKTVTYKQLCQRVHGKPFFPSKFVMQR